MSQMAEFIALIRAGHLAKEKRTYKYTEDIKNFPMTLGCFGKTKAENSVLNGNLPPGLSLCFPESLLPES